jgi:hypothetical protein
MSAPSQRCILTDIAVSPFTIPGTGRLYQAVAGTPITVPGDDAQILQGQGWFAVDGGGMNFVGAGPTASRPSPLQKNTSGSFPVYLDTTLGALIFYSGTINGGATGWVNAASGATNQ